MKNKFILFLLFVISTLKPMYGQVGINTNEPKATLDVSFNKEIQTAQGVLIPRIPLADLIELEGTYGADHDGILIQVIGPINQNQYELTNSSTKYIYQPGLYRYDADKNLWIETEKESWNGLETQSPATQNDIDIYKNGRIGIGTNAINETAQLDISSGDKGLLIPRLTSVNRDAIQQPANGLIIFNTTTRCLNYYDETVGKWLSMCGTYEPAKISLFNCEPPVGPQGTFKQGQTLSETNTYTLVIDVAEIGTYDILVETGNGYSFSQSGVFTEIGFQTIVLKGQGTPVNGPRENQPNVRLNGILVYPECTLPTIPVEGATTALNLNCDNYEVKGIYYKDVLTNSSNYIDIAVSNVITPGPITLQTDEINGLYFSSGAINISSNTETIRLYARGAPTLINTNPGYNFTLNYPNGTIGSNCQISVSVESSAGTFHNPLQNCKLIKEEKTTATDGYYWLSGSNGQKYKTYCDMNNGGWTLIKSVSEKNYISQNSSNRYTPISSFSNINKVTSENGLFNEYNFSLSIADLNIIQPNSIDYKFVIKEKGHIIKSNATLEEIESSTISLNNDPWAKENYYIVGIVGLYRPQTTAGTYYYNLHTMEGKVFGKDFTKVGTSNTYNFDGGTYTNGNGFYSSTFYLGYGNGGVGNPPSKEIVYTYPEGSAFAGETFTFNASHLKDLFGHFGSASYSQLNHHFLACNQGINSDSSGNSNCNGAWSNWRPHRVNEVLNTSGAGTGNFEGRILQIWMK